MWRAAEYLHSLAAPWILGGDFQMEPDQLLQGPPVHHMSAELVVPSGEQGTCRQQHKHSTIDYFLVHRKLQPHLDQMLVEEGWPSSPHKLVAAHLRAEAPVT